MGIAILSLACRYPDAPTPEALWENILAQRTAFRRMPACRLSVADYQFDRAPTCDTIATDRAAVLEDFVFDRVRFGVPGAVFRGADPVHWLALQVAAETLERFALDTLPRETAAVYLGNTLTGEVTRSRTLRQRWPYVRRTVAATLAEQGRGEAEIAAFLVDFETRFKAPFEEPDDETLAGGLANTIAGRLCAAFDFRGGGYVVDAACASSLLAVANACSALTSGDVDVALAGGVDISLDPFELVGFARVGAITKGEMRVYDARSSGFLPGEGCGFVLLMREEDARARGLTPLAVIRGWGVSSDGKGSITRPEVAGQQGALRRAYARAGYPAASVLCFEGHGTGTAVGDRVELTALSGMRDGAAEHAALSSIKANIGHTKAAAGIAGLIKATLCVQNRILPPATNTDIPNPLLDAPDAVLRLLRKPEPWPANRPVRAGVSASGFGGINVHITLEGQSTEGNGLSEAEQRLARSPQDTELLLLSAPTHAALLTEVQALAELVEGLSRAEWTDVSCQYAARPDNGPVRAAIVAANPNQASAALSELTGVLKSGAKRLLDAKRGLFLGDATQLIPLGFLFPGQGAPLYTDGGALGRRFDGYRPGFLPPHGAQGTAVAQPAIVAQSAAALGLLAHFGIEASVAVGHSLGELTALHWAGVLVTDTLISLACTRGKAMAAAGSPGSGMLSLGAGATAVTSLLDALPAVISGHNAPSRTLVSGSGEALAEVERRAKERGIAANRLTVTGAFHSPELASAVAPLSAFLESAKLGKPKPGVLSTITGAALAPSADIPTLLCAQLTDPVRFLGAITCTKAHKVGLWLEVGPGKMLSTLLMECRPDAVALALDAGGESVAGLLHALAATYISGHAIRREALFADRFYREHNFTQPRVFIENPCERAPSLPTLAPREPVAPTPQPKEREREQLDDALLAVRSVTAALLELPLEAILPELSLSRDFRLSSLVVSELVDAATHRLGIAPPAVPLELANATVSEIAEVLEQLKAGTLAPIAASTIPAGVAPWIRPFTVEWQPRALGRALQSLEAPGGWQVFGEPSEALRECLKSAPGVGVLVVVPEAPTDAIPLLLEAAKIPAPPFVLVTLHGGGAGFARTLAIESPERAVRVVHSDDPERLLAELNALTPGYREARFDSQGRRMEPVLVCRENQAEGELPLGPEDVLLITGGGKGIAAECALALAKACGVKLALIGRALPENDMELAANLARLAALGATVHYAAADVTDAAAVSRAVWESEAALGSITAVLHSAGINRPCRIAELTAEAFEATVKPKYDGLANLLAALAPERLKLLVSFGSIIGRSGLVGEADYAAANEWLRLQMDAFGVAHPHCQTLTMEWSVWSGVGMGEKLGTLQHLERLGITPISPEEGIAHLLSLLKQRATGSVVVAGRYGDSPTLRTATVELPPLRFIERVLVHYPGVELIAEATLSPATDPYLDDHVIDGRKIFPGVLGVEAMAQAATSLAGVQDGKAVTQLAFLAAVRVPDDHPVTIRLAALRQPDGAVRVALRSSETQFARDHFTATFHAETTEPGIPLSADFLPKRSLPEARSLYGPLFFQGAAFQRVRSYTHFGAFGCQALLEPCEERDWFGGFLPQTLLLGDPGVRDASLHALQVCIPYKTLVPVSVARIVRGPSEANGTRTLVALERSWSGERFVYDIEVRDTNHTLIERWEGLELAALSQATERTVPTALLPSVLERVTAACFPEHALQFSLEGERAPTYRPDGRPDGNLSRTHAEELTLTVTADGAVGADMEHVTPHPDESWLGLLGAERLALARALGGDLDRGATQLWVALESLAKVGDALCPPLRPLTPPPGLPETTALFTTGEKRVVTLSLCLAESSRRLALGLALKERP